jgi:hypothetical protein
MITGHSGENMIDTQHVIQLKRAELQSSFGAEVCWAASALAVLLIYIILRQV